MADKSFFSEKKDKAWFSNFWFYYRFHIMIIGFFLVLSVVAITQCMHNVTPDLAVSYISAQHLDETIMHKMTEEFTNYISDVDDKDGVVVDIYRMKLPDATQDDNDVNIYKQVMLELAAGESYLYLMDKDIFQMYADGGVFLDISEVTGDQAPVYGVNVKDNAFLQSLGLKPEKDLYICLRKIMESREGEEVEVKKQENAWSLLRAILKS